MSAELCGYVIREDAFAEFWGTADLALFERRAPRLPLYLASLDRTGNFRRGRLAKRFERPSWTLMHAGVARPS